MKNRRFAVFILAHGRPDNLPTIKALENAHYTGDYYIVCDDEDETLSGYEDRFGDKLRVFCKQEWLDKSDTFDCDGPRGVVLPARNYCWTLAQELGLDSFLVLDDDYTYFSIRHISEKVMLRAELDINLDEICEDYLRLLEANENILTVCFAQGGDYIGGANTFFKRRYQWKGMNSFFCLTNRPFQFYGRINEDLTASVLNERMGKILLTVGNMALNQSETQQKKGGLTESYLDMGTYRKSFYSVMACPSSVKVGAMGGTHYCIHHFVNWDKTCSRIVSSRWKRGYDAGQQATMNGKTYDQLRDERNGAESA